MTLWDTGRVRLGGHVTQTEGYDTKTPPLLIFPSERSGSEEQDFGSYGHNLPEPDPVPRAR